MIIGAWNGVGKDFFMVEGDGRARERERVTRRYREYKLGLGFSSKRSVQSPQKKST